MNAFKSLHKQYSFEPRNTDTAVLFVHGICGSPRVFLNMTTQIAAKGYAVCAMLLPGHGASSQAFSLYGKADWQRSLAQEAQRLRLKYSKLVFVSHSMGGLLCANELINNGADGLVLINTPMYLHISATQITMAANTFLRMGADATKDEKRQIYDQNFAVKLDNPVTAVMWIEQVYGLFRLMHWLHKKADQIECPVLIFQSAKDETVDPKSAKTLNKLISGSSLTWLAHSLHAYFATADLVRMTDTVLEFLKTLKN